MVFATAVFAVGCGDDSASPEDLGDDGTNQSTASESDTDPVPEDDTTDPSGAPTSSGGGAEGETDGLDDSGDEPGCSEINCGPSGYCVELEDGVPACECEAGYQSIGYGCVRCDVESAGGVLGTSLNYDVDVPIVDVVVDITIGGVDPPQSVYHDGNLFLRNRATGDQVLLGNTHDGTAIATIIPGTYDVYYSHESGHGVPLNRNALLETREFDNETTIDIDIPVAEIRIIPTLNGEAPPQSDYHWGTLYLISTTGDEIELHKTNGEWDTVKVVPGSYDVHYRHGAGEGTVPINSNTRFDFVTVSERGDGTVQEFEIDIPAVHISGPITMAGDAPPSSEYHRGTISLLDETTGDEFPIGDTSDGEYDAMVVPGEYRVIYGRIAGTAVPANQRAHLENAPTSFQVDASQPIDIPTMTLTGDFTFNGAPPPTSPSDDGIVSLKNADTGDVVVLGNTHDGTYSALMVPGTYDVYYSQETAGPQAPANTNHRLQSGVLVEANTLDIDVTTVPITGTITLNNESPPTSEYEDGRIYLRNSITGDSILLGNTRLASFSGIGIPGKYDVVYVAENASNVAPVNTAAKIDEVTIGAGAQDLLINIPAVDLDGNLSVGGVSGSETNPAEDLGLLYLVDVGSNDRIFIGRTDDDFYARTFAAGRYLTVFEGKRSSGVVPANFSAPFACIEIVIE